jgi:hypothetical protein
MINITGPVPLNSKNYIERKFEVGTRTSLLKRDWVLILGPRQHGKTSALIRINKYLNDSGFRSGLVDLQRMPPALDFAGLLSWFCNSVAESMGIDIDVDIKSNELIDKLRNIIPASGAPVIILIDEASSIRDEAQRNAFYGQIRAIKGAAAVSEPNSLETNLQFVFAGTFRPETLVDDLNSPFNVCIRIDTEDLNEVQISTLTSVALDCAVDEVTELVSTIYAEVGGQPHLIQSILADIEDKPIENRHEAIRALAHHWKTEGSEHIRSLFYLVVQNANLVKIVSTVATNDSVLNDPANVDYKFLTTAGLLRRQGANLVFRNKLYSEIAKSSTQLRPEQITTVTSSGFLLPLEDSDFSFIADEQLREITKSSYNGAINASNSKNFRLAVVGYGMALEAILMDWLTTKGPLKISSAINIADTQKRPVFSGSEKAANPLTWKLVNLMKVGRLMNGVKGPIDLPDSLREFRNWVHPAVIKKTYQAESNLEPEARACNALLSIIIRDIS